MEAQLATARAEERERCAKVADQFYMDAEVCGGTEGTLLRLADAIRALTLTPEPRHD